VRAEGALRAPDPAAIDAAVARCERPFARRANGARGASPHGAHGALEPLRETLSGVMWERVGIIRDAAGLASAERELSAIDAALDDYALADANRAFNLSWHDWMNLKSLTEVSRVIAAAARARQDSRGAHFRSDFPDAGSLEHSAYTSARLEAEQLAIASKPVAFTRVRPGETLLKDAA